MKVFWSWQNDIDPKSCRHFVRDALAEAVKEVGDEMGLDDAERPELDHDTKDEPGMVDIAATILNKASECAVFVADLTPIGRTDDGKALPNPNVLIELGWALNKPGFRRIIPIVNTANGFSPEDLPFDIRHKRVICYKAGPGDEPILLRAASAYEVATKHRRAPPDFGPVAADSRGSQF